jgi:ABC-type branched-subunit amino acid transport system substrate-binding protein
MLEVLRGAQLYVDFANRTGGVGGVKVEIVARNDDFKVDRTWKWRAS